MGQFKYRVAYKTSETRPEVEETLRARCLGSWDLLEMGRQRRSAERHDFLVSFEREADINALFAAAPAVH